MGAKGWYIPVSNMVHAHRKTEDTATVAVKKRKTTESTGSVGEGHNHASHATQATRNKEKVPERERETRKDKTTNPERTRDAATIRVTPYCCFSAPIPCLLLGGRPSPSPSRGDLDTRSCAGGCGYGAARARGPTAGRNDAVNNRKIRRPPSRYEKISTEVTCRTVNDDKGNAE